MNRFIKRYKGSLSDRELEIPVMKDTAGGGAAADEELVR